MLRGFQILGFKFELPLFKVVRYSVLNGIDHEVSAVTSYFYILRVQTRRIRFFANLSTEGIYFRQFGK